MSENESAMQSPESKKRGGWPKGKPRGPRPTVPAPPPDIEPPPPMAAASETPWEQLERVLEVDLSKTTRMRVQAGTEATEFLSRSKGYDCRVDWSKRVIQVRHSSGNRKTIPFEWGVTWEPWREANAMEKIAAIPQVLVPGVHIAPLPNAPVMGPGAAMHPVVQGKPGQPPPGWLKVKRKDLGPTAIAQWEREGFIMVGEQKAIVED